MGDGTCDDCKHRQPKQICGCPKSPYFNRRTERTDSCASFLKNPATERLRSALLLASEQSNIPRAIPEAQAALNLGLSSDDEVTARHILGEAILFLEIERMKGKKEADINPMSQRLSEGIYHLETALTLDAQDGHGFYLHPPTRGACCWRLEPLYELRAEWIRNQKGIDAAAEYLEKKLRLFEYLPGVYMAALHFQLALYVYEEKNQKRQADDHYRKVIEAKDLSEDLGESFIGADYKNNLRRHKALAWMRLAGVGSKWTPEKSLEVAAALGQLCESDPASRDEILAHFTNSHLDCLELALAQVGELEKNDPQKAQEMIAAGVISLSRCTKT